MGNFVVFNSPFVHSGNDVNKMFLYMAVALVVPAVYGVIFFGITALIMILVSLASCMISEMLFNVINGNKFKVDNFSFFVTGMILSLTLPINTPILAVIASAFFSIFIVKQAFGGLGFNKFNPANTGRCFAGIIVPALGTALHTFSLNGETYESLTTGGVNTLSNLLAGQAVGGIGTTCILLIAICAIALAFAKVIDFKIPFFAILAYFITAFISVGFEQALFNMLSGSFIFVCVFMMTDPNTSPDTYLGKLLYSILFGVISALCWINGNLGENTIFAVALFVNILAPIFDRYLTLRPISRGGIRNAHKK